ncbi:hypothetical protein SAMN05443270_1480 [Lacrimispora sphenoides]|uniref:hypothetical protein n=1 Tax=Lacrimispora sphenoides TaxID=29370 RepID=UPI0008B145A4|nr:hypothetical protein [Lacrimispora sphenoides]SET80063.1 hypothetical protein SAMN05443270_1480 [Lacrimispora sphenoides]
MQPASQKYKELMRREFRDPFSYIRVTIGLINQEAQASAYVPEREKYTYYSSFKMPLDNYEVKELYATCDQNYTAVDGSMYFLPRERADVVLNQGIVSEELPGPIEIRFPIEYDIKGLTIEFGKAYPVDFVIESDNNTVEIKGNTDGHFVTEEIFNGATFLRLTPSAMINSQSRFRIHKITMGIGIYFDNRKILSATKKEHISPIMEELPAIDFSLTVNNKDRAFDIENQESSVNFLEIGQDISVLYGQELDDGSVEWLPGATVQLKEWSADDEQMEFSATDRFDGMDGTYYKGLYRPEGISLYDLAVDVFSDAGVDYRSYWIDPYLKSVKVVNPMPVVSHKEALQLIANAGRCILYQDREGNILLKSSFIPDMEASSNNETYFSNAGAVLDKTMKKPYAMTAQDYTDVTPTRYFLPRQEEGATYLNAGYVSEAVAKSDGSFMVNPTVEIGLEASFKCFGLTLEFGDNSPAAMVFHAYRDGSQVEDYIVTSLTATTVIGHEFEEFDKLILEFTKGHPNNRVVLNNITFGDSTDYIFEYGHELTKTPRGTQLAKVRELQVIRTLYNQTNEVKELAKETIAVTSADNRYTFYFSNPVYDLSCSLTEPQGGQTVAIVESSSYCATVEITGAMGAVEVSVSGREYLTSQTKVGRQLNPTGSLETWENPLVSDMVHAADLTDWIGDYMKSDREYDLQYRGEPRIDANDIAFLENKYVPDLLLRVHEHTLKFNGALSGTVKARRDMSNVATTKN